MEKYTKVRSVGKGNMGSCVLARNNEDGRLYVIKQVDLTKMNKKERQQSLNEALLLKSLHHPNVIHYVDSFLSNRSDHICIVMEYADSGDLSSRIKKSYGVNFRETQIVDWIIQLVLSLSYVHKRKVLHRDVKSQNVFLTSQNVLKLGDFGIARTLSGTYDQAKTFVGTPYYLSPELIMERPYDHRSDVWALGVIIYELMALKHPFNANSMRGLMQRILKLQYDPVPLLYTTELRNIVPRILTKDPAQRIKLSDLLELPILQRRMREWMLSDVMPKSYIDSLLRNGLLPQSIAALKTSCTPTSDAALLYCKKPENNRCLPTQGDTSPTTHSVTSTRQMAPKAHQTPEYLERVKAPDVAPDSHQKPQKLPHIQPSLPPSLPYTQKQIVPQTSGIGQQNINTSGVNCANQPKRPKQMYINYKNINGVYNSSSVSGSGAPVSKGVCPVPLPSPVTAQVPTSIAMRIPQSLKPECNQSAQRHSPITNTKANFSAISVPNRVNVSGGVAAAPSCTDIASTGRNSNNVARNSQPRTDGTSEGSIMYRLAEHLARKRNQQEQNSAIGCMNPFLQRPLAEPAPLPYLSGAPQIDINAMLHHASLERAKRRAT
ncbi:putative protein kinase [Trypanosoma vivax]|uniref:non-specific serine/threonine protein kinase n=1 Tax=Trypanosoma vivax (strain Y486) TaxID=1055687 RepID=G0TYG7_TRYVY|nr:putative protein kinase [Trypanosoma vivax]CCC49014.1 putative protein kinase [Trypanosoma vivax Y486]